MNMWMARKGQLVSPNQLKTARLDLSTSCSKRVDTCRPNLENEDTLVSSSCPPSRTSKCLSGQRQQEEIHTHDSQKPLETIKQRKKKHPFDQTENPPPKAPNTNHIANIGHTTTASRTKAQLNTKIEIGHKTTKNTSSQARK